MQQVSVLLQGGLGNQLFTYFAGCALSLHLQKPLQVEMLMTGSSMKHGSSIVKLGLRDFPNVQGNFDINGLSRFNRVSSHLFRLFRLPFLGDTYTSYGFGYDANLYRLSKPCRISGYFQTHKYLRYVLSKDREKTKFSDSTFTPVSVYKNTVGVHLRRGDTRALSNSVGLLSDEYFRRALSLTSVAKPGVKLLVFSDEISFAQDLFYRLGYESKAEFIGTPISNVSSEDSLLMMSGCDEIVLSNSTFSWWAATFRELNFGKGLIISPSNWYRSRPNLEDFTFDHWVSVPSVFED